MEKLVLTTYRKIVKMGASLDKDVAKRSAVSCAPTSFFNHRTSTWTEVDIAKEVGWTEPRAFLDKLIRRLNGNRENYIPPTVEELEHARASAVSATLAAAAAAPAETTADAASATSAPDSEAARAVPTTAGTRASPINTAVLAIPPFVEPFMSIQRTARVLFESTPFSMNNLNKAFAAVKELSYACESFRATASSSSSGSSSASATSADASKTSMRRLVTLPPELASMPTPALKRAMTVAPAEDLQLMHGLSDDLRESLRMMAPEKGDIVRGAERRADDNEEDDMDDDEEGEVVVTVVAAVDEDAEMPSDVPHIIDAPAAAEDRVATATASASVASAEPTTTTSASARTTVFSPASSAANSGELKPPATVQFLIAHPQLTGFFQNAVMLVVRNAENEAIALVLNTPLRCQAATQLVMARDALCGFPGAHPIYEKHLQYNSVMIGGPVQTGESPEEVALLHQIPGVPGAIPLAQNLFLHGDLDVIMGKLDAGEVSARDVVLLVGFAGWGRDQLQGEVRSGVWLVAHGAPDEAETGNFVMSLARAAGACLAVPPAAKAKVPESAETESVAAAVKVEEATSTSATAAKDDPEEVARGLRRHVNFMATVRDGTVMAWMLALKAMKEPYASLGRNQKRSTRGKSDDFVK